jgi:hypothetical protein
VKVLRTNIFAAAFVVIAAPAIADSPSWTAVPVRPPSVGLKFVGNTVVWTCADTGCYNVSSTSQAASMAECRSLARKVGQLSSFSTQKGRFPDSELAKCNQAAPTP